MLINSMKKTIFEKKTCDTKTFYVRYSTTGQPLKNKTGPQNIQNTLISRNT